MRVSGIAVGLLLAGAFSSPYAQQAPSQTMRMIVPTSAGGSADLIGRMVADILSKRLGETVVTENRPGAGQTIGAQHVVQSPPDGRTMTSVTVTYTTSAAIYKKLPYDPMTALTGVAMIGIGPMLLVVHPSLPVKNVKQLIALAKSRPGQLNYGSAGTGSIPHLAAEVFQGSTGIEMVHVPYKGIAPAVTATVAGEVPVLFTSTPAGGAMVKANRLRPLAVSTAKRSAFMPELPTIAESGVPGFDVATWWGILTHGNTPRPVVEKLNKEIRAGLAQDDVKARIVANGAEPVDLSVDEFNKLIRSDIEKWRRTVKERKIPMS